MQILFLSSGLSDRYGGAPLSESSLANELSTHHRIIVLCPRDRFEARFSRKNVFCPTFDFTRTEVISAFGNGEHWLSKLFETSDVLHINGHWRWENYLFARLAQKYGIPYFLHPRGMLVLNRRRPILKRAFNLLIGNQIARGASRVIALSEYETKQFEPYGIARERSLIIPNGLPEADVAHITRLKNLDGRKYLLYFGRIDPRKNLPFLIETFAQIAPRFSDVDLYLVGPAEKNHDSELQAKINNLALEKRIRILPGVYGEGKWALLKGASAVIYPAIDEAFGRVVFEALKAEVFPIFPDQSGGAEYLQGFLPFCSYKQKASLSLIRSIETILEAKEVHKAALTNAQAWARAQLSWPKIAARVSSAYRQALKETTSESPAFQPHFDPAH